MGDLVNLNKARKRRAKEAADRDAADNRVRHGRTLSERRQAHDEVARRTRLLDGAALPTADDDGTKTPRR